MKRIFAAAAIAAAVVPSPALAQERVGSAALGAVSGGLILGPVGAVAGAVVGYAAGPSIARAWGLHNPPPPQPARRAKPAALKNVAAQQPGTQRASTPAASTQDARASVQPRAQPAPRPAAAPRVAMPPVQALE